MSSMNPLQGMAVAITRQTQTGEPIGGWLPDERIDLQQALTAYTAGSAYQGFLDGISGTIEVDCRADLALIDANLDEVEPLDLWDVPIVTSYVDGVATNEGEM